MPPRYSNGGSIRTFYRQQPAQANGDSTRPSLKDPKSQSEKESVQPPTDPNAGRSSQRRKPPSKDGDSQPELKPTIQNRQEPKRVRTEQRNSKRSTNGATGTVNANANTNTNATPNATSGVSLPSTRHRSHPTTVRENSTTPSTTTTTTAPAPATREKSSSRRRQTKKSDQRNNPPVPTTNVPITNNIIHVDPPPPTSAAATSEISKPKTIEAKKTEVTKSKSRQRSSKPTRNPTTSDGASSTMTAAVTNTKANTTTTTTNQSTAKRDQNNKRKLETKKLGSETNKVVEVKRLSIQTKVLSTNTSNTTSKPSTTTTTTTTTASASSSSSTLSSKTKQRNGDNNRKIVGKRRSNNAKDHTNYTASTATSSNTTKTNHTRVRKRQPSKTAPPKTDSHKAEPRKSIVQSLCGSSSIEIVGEPHRVKDLTFGGQRRQKHNSWFGQVSCPWLEDQTNDVVEQTSGATPANTKLRQKSRQVKAKDTQGAVAYTDHQDVLTHCGSQTIKLDATVEPHPKHHMTLGGQRRHTHGSWHDLVESPWLNGDTTTDSNDDNENDTDDDDDEEEGIEAKRMPLDMPTTTSNAQPTKWVSVRGSHSIKARRGTPLPHLRHDLTLGGQRRQKHNSWSAIVPSPWLNQAPDPSTARQPVSHFLSIPITSNALISKLTQFQEAVMKQFPQSSTKRARIHPSKFHLTIGLIRKPYGELMVEFENRISDAFQDVDWAVQDFVKTASAPKLNTSVPNTFQDTVSIIDLSPNSSQIVQNLSIVLYEQMEMNGVTMDPPNDHPHITVFKGTWKSRGFKARNTLKVKPPTNFGSQVCTHIDLCCMKDSQRNPTPRYYETLASIEF